ncbi:Fatty-acid peroxygenase [Pseudobythopirellula maris]|uniref:Fatty-acid peroxygenase n=1 Tax=Pseudobythopirellula maris TaxID=2527991 RepID=A0A5C5ZT24_9BACT|nr:cytochrome P450 [Pseudobythopirellula maris]TWT90376.1 Fatty-acid peroxygenase [Pseudobythopirellula maris]
MNTTASKTPSYPEATLALAAEPYDFISRQCSRFGTDVFATRLLLRKTLCMTGPDAARLFYDDSKFRRAGAAPGALTKTLLGRGGVQGLDGESHRRRKAMFLSMTDDGHAAAMAACFHARLHHDAGSWSRAGEVTLYGALHEVLCRAACEWVGVPLPEEEVGLRTRQLTSLFDHAGSRGPKHILARWRRWRADRWMERVVQSVRSGELVPPQGAPLRIIAEHVDADGAPMTDHEAAVEALNLVRPVVAVSVYVVFVALALEEHAGCRERVRAGDDAQLECFAQEVRRYYPFFPCLVAETRDRFEWRGHEFPAGRRVLLDVYGTNHDPRVWDDPEAFRPERFADGRERPFGFIPQGGGDPALTHRCPGERIALELMKTAAAFLTREIEYTVPQQDLRVNRRRMPALPASRFHLNVLRLNPVPPRQNSAP